MMAPRHTIKASLALLALLALGACGTPEQKEARYIKRGDKLLEEKEFAKARLEYRNAARLMPTDPNALYHLGLVDDAEGNFRDAFVNFTNTEQQDGHFHPALLKLAEYYLAGDLFAEANQRIDLVLSETPTDPEARALLAARYLKQKMYAEAENEALKALSFDTKNVLAYGVLAGVYKAQGSMDRAISNIETGIQNNPKDETLLRLRAELYSQQDDLQKTERAYKDLFIIAPHEKKYRLDLAQNYINAGQIDRAEETLRTAISDLPQDWDIKKSMIKFLTAHRDISTTEKELQSYIISNPEKFEPIDWLVELYISHDLIAQLDTFLDQTIAKNAHDQLWLHAMTAKAKVEYLKHDDDKAQGLLSNVLTVSPNDLNAQFLKARIEADRGADDQAVIDLRAIIRDKPNSKEAYTLLSEILLRQGRRDLAIETLNQLADIGPLTAEQQVRLAQIYALNGNTTHAREILLFATKTEPLYPVGWEMTARLALDLKDLTTAESAINTLDGLSGQHLTALFLKGQYQVLTGKPQDGITAFKTIVGTDIHSPQAEHALPALIKLYISLNQLSDGIQYLESLPLPTPTSNTLLGDCYLMSHDLAKASIAFDKAISMHPAVQDAYIERAKIFISQNKVEAAQDLLNQAATVDPADIRASLANAQLSEQDGNYKQALNIYLDLLVKHPESDIVANNFSEEVADNFKSDPALLEKARQVAERFTASNNPLLLDTLGWVYFRQGKSQEALNIYERALSLAPDLPPQFHYHYGATLASTGSQDKAQVELKLATVDGSFYPGKDDAKNILRAIGTSN